MVVQTESAASGELVGLGSFETFFRVHFATVARTAGLVVHDFGVGEELAQEAFTRVYQRWDRFGSTEHARNLAFRAAVNLARSHLRKHGRVQLRANNPERPAGRDLATSAIERIEVWRALGNLSVRQRECIVLVDYAGYDVRSTAQILRTRESTVRVHLTRGRRALRAALALEEAE
jgi:RNA polymerase sigma factor (sigma-70 family)